MSQTEARKRPRMSLGYCEEYPRIIPSLPDEISSQILARLPRICYLNVKSVSKSWKSAITSREVFQLRKELGTSEEWLYILSKVQGNKLLWHALDPLSSKWQKLPLMPMVVHEEESKKGLFRMWNMMGSSIRMADVIRGWLGWKDSLDQIPFCGCAVGVVDGCLYVLGGFSSASAVNSVWRYDPRINIWEEVSSMATGRAFCKTGLLKNKLYVVGGVSRDRGSLTPLRSAEVFDPNTDQWTQVPSMPFSKALDLPTAFLADMLKPIATGMTTYKGRLCVPQSLYTWPFFIDIGGEIYDPETGSWVEMPAGMGDGWPARQAGTKLGAVVNGKLYALEPSSSLDSGKIKVYDDEEDVWKVVIPKVPLCDFADSESPYLLAGFLDKVHVITKYADNDITVLQADLETHKCTSSSYSSSPSTSQSPPVNCTSEKPGCSVEEESDIWKVIAAKNLGDAELVSCQVLDL